MVDKIGSSGRFVIKGRVIFWSWELKNYGKAQSIRCW